MKMTQTLAFRRAMRAATAVRTAANKRRAGRVCLQALKQMLDQPEQYQIKRTSK